MREERKEKVMEGGKKERRRNSLRKRERGKETERHKACV